MTWDTVLTQGIDLLEQIYGDHDVYLEPRRWSMSIGCRGIRLTTILGIGHCHGFRDSLGRKHLDIMGCHMLSHTIPHFYYLNNPIPPVNRGILHTDGPKGIPVHLLFDMNTEKFQSEELQSILIYLDLWIHAEGSPRT